jgi:cell migration-inducing and hyaluronan-binding protein
MSVSVSELDAGSWVIFELPGFTSATTGTAQDSLDALRKATSTSYYRGEGALWVKLVSTGGGGANGRGAVGTIQVSR